MNLFLTSRCNERCPFCYAERFMAGRPPDPATDASTGRILGHLRTYADLVRKGGTLPLFRPEMDEETRSLYSARTVNLLGGEPTIHPAFARIVEEIARLGLGAMVFTNASLPARIREVKDLLWTVVVNGHFAERAGELGMPMSRVHANLPIQPGVDVVRALARVRDAGIRTVYLAFAAPAGGTGGTYFTPQDLDAMKEVHRAAMDFCREAGILVAYDCSFPVCVDRGVLQTKCTSVPVMDTDGYITICGGEYFMEEGRRHISTFRDIREVHAYTFRLISGLRSLPSTFDVCNRCEHFNRECHGMCLAFRVKPAAATAAATGAATVPAGRGADVPADAAMDWT